MIKKELEIGEVIKYRGSKWKRTALRDSTSTYADNYYYEPLECFCHQDEGGGYTYQDEYGDCDYCLGLIRQIFGHNDSKKK